MQYVVQMSAEALVVVSEMDSGLQPSPTITFIPKLAKVRSGDIQDQDQETAQYMYWLHHQYEILYWCPQYIHDQNVMAYQNPDCLIADIFSATCT